MTIFAALLKNVPMGCPDSVIPEPLLRNNHVNCLISNQDTKQPYNDNLCLFRALAVNLHGTTGLETSTSKIFNDFLEKSGYDPKQFRGVSMDNLPVVEDVVEKNIFIYDINIEDGDFVGELARRSIGKYENTVKLLRYNNHIIYVNNIDNFFKCFRCPTCDTFFHKADHFNKHLLRCKDRIKNIYPKNVYTLRETLFEKLDGFNIEYTKEQTLFKNVAIFDFESICVPSEELKPTETITWIGKHEPISVSISSNLLDKPIFLCAKDPQSLIIDFVANFELLAEKNKTEMRSNFLEIENNIKKRLHTIFSILNERVSFNKIEAREYEDECIENEEETDASTHFLRIQKNQLIDLMQHLERYTNTLPVFGFNSGRYDINLIKSYLIPYLIKKKEIEPSVIKKANDFVAFKFGDVQLLDIMKFLGGATTLDSFLKAYKASELKGYFPYEWFDTPNKLDEQQLPSYDDFYSKLKNSNPLDKEFDDYQKLLNTGITEEQALKKLGLKTKPATGLENYNYLKSIWEQEKMTTFRDFLRWYNNKDVVPTLDAMQKMIEFYHDKGIDMLKLGCTLPNLANICLHKSTDYKFYPFFFE